MKLAELTVLCPEQKRNDNGCNIGTSPFLWLMSLEVYLRTFCKVGSYLVTDPEDDRSVSEIAASPQVPNIDPRHIEEHLALCRSFILEWTTKGNAPSESVVLPQVSRIDYRIRTRWTDAYRANVPENITFTRCMMRAESTSDRLWAADLTRDMHTGKGGPSFKDIQAALAAKGAKVAKGANEGRETKTEKGATKGAKAKDKGKGTGVVMGQTLTVSNRKLKTVKSRGDTVFCSYYSSAKGCSKGQACALHSCSVLTAKGRVCEANHSAAEHTGNSFSGQD